MRRRDVLTFFVLGAGVGVAASLISCDADTGPDPANDPVIDGGTTGADAAASGTADACTGAVVYLHDTHAQALYLDGSNGPLTGIVTVTQMTTGTVVTFDFWHGHGGVLHRFTLTAEQFAQLQQRKRVTVQTTTVEGHSHMLFVDPVDERYRVANAPDVAVTLGC